MKFTQACSVFSLGLIAVSDAYPSIARHLADEAAAKKDNTLLAKVKRAASLVPFDAGSQYISNTGDHAFVAPGDGDARGPCPGLNAMANHNYMPHNGVGTITQFVEGTTKVFGMGADLAAFLAGYGAVMDGDLTSWSIGGPSDGLPSIGLLGTPQGISGSHNKYENDASPTRGDLYQKGNDYSLQMDQFQALYDAGKASDSYDLDVLTSFRSTRFQESVENNPFFFYGPFTGVAVTPAAYSFIYRFMSNKSAENPEGVLNGEVLKSFFAITGEDGDFTYQPGWEKIPDNWYTRNVADAYTIPYLNSDTVAMGVAHPEFLVPGGNTGTTNSYIGLDPSDLSGGVYSLGNIASDDNAMCLALELGVQALPDLLEGLFSDSTGAENQLGSTFSTVTNSLGCPKLSGTDNSAYDQFPGYKNLKSDGTY